MKQAVPNGWEQPVSLPLRHLTAISHEDEYDRLRVHLSANTQRTTTGRRRIIPSRTCPKSSSDARQAAGQAALAALLE